MLAASNTFESHPKKDLLVGANANAQSAFPPLVQLLEACQAARRQ
jgi:hypothetical protein